MTFDENQPQDIRSYVDAEHIIKQLGEMTPDQKARLTQDLAQAFWQAARGFALPDAKHFVNTRILNNGTEVTADSDGTDVGLSGGKSQFDILNFVGGAASIDSASNARQVNVQVGGGGADCMFDVLVSTCFASLTGFSEGDSFTSISGCTFYGYSTIQAACDKMVDLGGARAMYICKGSYTENVSLQNNNVAYTVVGAGADIVTLTGTGSGAPAFQIGTATTFTITGMTMVGSGSNVVLNHVNGGLLNTWDLVLKPQSGGTGFQFTGGEFVSGLRIAGTSAAIGITNGSVPSPPSFFNDVWITGCGIGFKMLGGPNRVEIRSAYISSATTGISLGSDSAADRSIITGVVFSSCTTGISLITNALDDSLVTHNVFYQCTTGVDLSGLATGGVSTGSRGSTIASNIFYTTTSSNTGIKANGSTAAFKSGIITLNNFRGYTAGNEIKGTGSLGTGTQVFHNATDSGTALADFGSPVGHSSSGGGTGSAAPNDQTFLTVTDESTALPNSRQITAGTGISLTDGGAGGAETIAVDTTAVYSYRQYVNAPDAAPGAVIVTGNQQGNIYHSGAAGFTATKLYVDAESAPGASGLPVTWQYGDTDDLDTVSAWTTIATLTLSSEKSSNTTTMSNATVPANRLIRTNWGTIVGSPTDATTTLQGKVPLTT